MSSGGTARVGQVVGHTYHIRTWAWEGDIFWHGGNDALRAQVRHRISTTVQVGQHRPDQLGSTGGTGGAAQVGLVVGHTDRFRNWTQGEEPFDHGRNNWDTLLGYVVGQVVGHTTRTGGGTGGETGGGTHKLYEGRKGKRAEGESYRSYKISTVRQSDSEVSFVCDVCGHDDSLFSHEVIFDQLRVDCFLCIWEGCNAFLPNDQWRPLMILLYVS